MITANTIPSERINVMSKHIGYKLGVQVYGRRLVVECDTCKEELEEVSSWYIGNAVSPAPTEPSGSCNMDEGCVSCGS